jgi:hypothetical protein
MGTMKAESNVPDAEERINKLNEIRKTLQEKLREAGLKAKAQYDKGREKAKEFQVGEKVWLNSKNIKTTQPSQGLAHKWLGPYPIVRKFGEQVYELQLPHKLKIHNRFHENLLKEYKENPFSGRIQEPPPPVQTEFGEEEYEVEKILDSKVYGKEFTQYLVEWKNYPPSENSWETEGNLLPHAKEVIDEFHQAYPEAYKGKDWSMRKKKGRKGGPKKGDSVTSDKVYKGTTNPSTLINNPSLDSTPLSSDNESILPAPTLRTRSGRATKLPSRFQDTI